MNTAALPPFTIESADLFSRALAEEISDAVTAIDVLVEDGPAEGAVRERLDEIRADLARARYMAEGFRKLVKRAIESAPAAEESGGR